MSDDTMTLDELIQEIDRLISDIKPDYFKEALNIGKKTGMARIKYLIQDHRPALERGMAGVLRFGITTSHPGWCLLTPDGNTVWHNFLPKHLIATDGHCIAFDTKDIAQAFAHSLGLRAEFVGVEDEG